MRSNFSLQNFVLVSMSYTGKGSTQATARLQKELKGTWKTVPSYSFF